jgi:hypothetical protein
LREWGIPFQIRATDSVKPTHEELLAEGRNIFRELQEESVRNGTDNMTMEEINAVVAESSGTSRHRGLRFLLVKL